MKRKKSKSEVDDRTGRSRDEHIHRSPDRSAAGGLTGGQGRAESLDEERHFRRKLQI